MLRSDEWVHDRCSNVHRPESAKERVRILRHQSHPCSSTRCVRVCVLCVGCLCVRVYGCECCVCEWVCACVRVCVLCLLSIYQPRLLPICLSTCFKLQFQFSTLLLFNFNQACTGMRIITMSWRGTLRIGMVR